MKQLKSIRKNSSKAIILCIAFALISKQDNAQVCSNPSATIYSLSNAGGIYPISTSNANVGSIVNSTSYGSSTSANSIGYNTVNGLFYYFQVAISGAKTFVSYNPTSGVYTTLAASSIAATVNRGCVNFNGTGYYCLDVNGNLFYYDIASNTWTTICSTFKDQNNNNVTSTFSSEGSGDMAIDGYGNLWIVCSNGSNYGLYELSAPLPTTTVASLTLQRWIAPTAATPAGIGFVGIAFDPTGNIYMATSTDLYILQNTSTLNHIGAFSVGGVCGDLTSCSYPYSVLAVTFENFTAAAQSNNSVSVSWSVAQQKNTKGYYVEHSSDGSNWNNIGFIESNENTETSSTYNFVDNNPANGVNYYRIHEVDIDGAGNLSEIKSVSFAGNPNKQINIWPNPAKDVVYVQDNDATGNTRFEVYDMFGKAVANGQLHAGNNTINISNLPDGSYIIHTGNSNGQIENHQVIKH